MAVTLPVATAQNQGVWSLVRVSGRSMLPTLAPGDVLLVRRGRRGAAVGRLAVVDLGGGRPAAVKRLASRQVGGWWVERDNPAEGVDSWLVGEIADAGVSGIVAARVWPRPRRL
jgi:phage repressor protein C with HTH and peptisase S24 domain